MIDCEIDTPTLPLLHCPPSGAIVRYEMFSSSAPLMIYRDAVNDLQHEARRGGLRPNGDAAKRRIRVKKMKLINDDDLAMGFAILALCYMLWLATDFILQYGGGWIG